MLFICYGFFIMLIEEYIHRVVGFTSEVEAGEGSC